MVGYAMHRSSGTKLSATDSSGGLEGADHMWNHAMIWCWFNRSFLARWYIHACAMRVMVMRVAMVAKPGYAVAQCHNHFKILHHGVGVN